jgi:hypothetical protein
MQDAMNELADKLFWRPIETAPRDRFIVLYCAEDNSRWWAKWQGDQWYGVDELGLTRTGRGPEDVTGWEVTAWMPIPDPPYRGD